MGDSNWIKLNRSIWDCFLWNFEKPKYGLCWIDMLLMANYKDKNILFDGKRMLVPRGTFVTSMVKLSKRWDMDRATVKRFLNMLQDDGMITYTCNNRCTVVNIVKYEVYQNFISDDATADSTTDATADPTADSTQHKNIKEGKEDKELNIITLNSNNSSSEPEKPKKPKEPKEPKPEPVKQGYGEAKNVLLTDEELQKLKTKYSDWEDRIENLSLYMLSTGKKYKSHYATILNWARKEEKERQQGKGQSGRKELVPGWMQKKNGFNNFEQGTTDYDVVERQAVMQSVATAATDESIRARAEALKQQFNS